MEPKLRRDGRAVLVAGLLLAPPGAGCGGAGSETGRAAGGHGGTGLHQGTAGGGGAAGLGGAGGGGKVTAVGDGGNLCPRVISVGSLPAGNPPAKSLKGAVGPEFPQCTAGFSVVGTAVTGTGTSTPGSPDFFCGEVGVAYDVVIQPDAKLYGFADNSATGAARPTILATPANTPNEEVVAFSTGTFENHGTVSTYPLAPNTAADDYKQTAGVVYIDSDAAHPATITNYGVIGDHVTGSFGVSDALSGYGQVNSAGIFSGPAAIVNALGAYIGGYNAVFTNGAGTLDNYGLIEAINDGALTAFAVKNHPQAGINTTVAGFACIHSYGNVDNWGYMLGQDYGLLVEGAVTINTYGGAPVPGVTNFDGSQVYDGEISSLVRGTPPKANTTGPYLAGDAILVDGNGTTVNLIAQTIGGVLYLPVIVGPMDGGFNGTFNSKTDNKKNTLNFQFDGLPASDAAALKAAIAASKTTGANGAYYSGTATVRGNLYHWEDFATVAYTGQ